MRQYSQQEIQALIQVNGGDDQEKAAALAVVQSAIMESRRLGRVALRQEGSRWQRERSLRSPESSNWGSRLR